MRGGRKSHDKEIYQVVQKDGPSVPPGPGRKVNWSNTVDIPHVVPSGLGGGRCPCIKVNYELIVTLSKFVSLRVKLPLHIGTPDLDDDIDDTISLAYGLEMTRSEFSSLDLDSISLAGEESESGLSSWSSVVDLRHAPPCYSATITRNA